MDGTERELDKYLPSGWKKRLSLRWRGHAGTARATQPCFLVPAEVCGVLGVNVKTRFAHEC